VNFPRIEPLEPFNRRVEQWTAALPDNLAIE
jgi:hypothetical protein